jgi:hypothetical protein
MVFMLTSCTESCTSTDGFKQISRVSEALGHLPT